MGRKVNKLRVAEAGLYGSYQRLNETAELPPPVLAAERADAERSAAESETKVIALSGDPAQVQAAVEARAAARLTEVRSRRR